MNNNFARSRYISYQQITALSAATKLTVPDATEFAIVKCETQAVRFTAGIDAAPTATVGYPLATATELVIDAAEIRSYQFIEQTASAKLNIVYFGRNTTL